jgi:chorismate synthase
MGPERLAERPEPVTLPRPGHADLAGALKYDRQDARDILERASARETAARTAAGAVARTLLAACGVEVCSRVRSIAGERDPSEPTVEEIFDARPRIEESSLRVYAAEAEQRMRTRIHELSHQGDTAGGVVEVLARGVLPGLGSHVQWDRRLDGRIAQAMLSVQAMKAVEIGDGWAAADRPGSAVHDPIGYEPEGRRFIRTHNHAGGVEGGISNGEPVVVRVAMKPIATLRAALPSADLRSKQAAPAAHERSDVCAVAAAGVILEATLCLVLADAMLEKHGADSLKELLRNLEGYRAQLRAY